MARYKVIIMVDGSRLPTIQKEAEAAFKGDVLSVQKVDLSKSRADRLKDISDTVSGSIADVEELKDELQEWIDSMPEGLQSSDKASELEEAIQALDEIKDALESVDFDSVSFPSMM